MIDYIKKNPLLLLLIIFGFLAYMITIIPSGTYIGCFDNFNHGCNINFWGAHGHDAIWHLAIVAVSFKHFPFIAPTFAGAQLSGYNYFLDIIIFLLTRIGIPAIVTYFKILPVIWFLLFTGLIIQFGKKLHDSALFIGILLFFMYFSGSFSYFITLLKERTIWNSGALLAMQPLLSLTNVQFAFSLCFLLYILIIIKEERYNMRTSTLLSALVALNVALKFYGGVISIFLVGLYFIITFAQKKDIVFFIKQMGILTLSCALSIILFYNPFAPTTPGAILTFKPFATVHQIIEDPNLFYMKDMVNARYFLEQSGKFSPRLIWIELQTLALFLILNFGTRIVGLFYVFKLLIKKQFTTYHLLLTATIIFAMFLNIFFVQKGQWWNTVQFSYYAFFLMNIFTTLALYQIVKRFYRVGLLIVSAIMILSIPSTLDILKTFAEQPAHSSLPYEEYVALNFLKSQPEGVVFTPLPSKKSVHISLPVPLSAMQDSAYIAAFSEKQQYIADEVQLQLTGVDYEARAKMSKDWNCTVIKHVDYLYVVKQENPIDKKLEACKNQLKQIYQNDLVIIYSVSQSQLLTH